MDFLYIRWNALHVTRIRLLVFILIVHFVRTINNVIIFFILKVKNVIFSVQKQIHYHVIIKQIIKWRSYSSHRLIWVRNMSVLLVRYKFYKNVICVRIVIISFFVRNVMRKERLLKVYMQIAIRNIMCLHRCFDYLYMNYIYIDYIISVMIIWTLGYVR